MLQLREIVELICAPAITTDQVAYLKILIEEYIYFRGQLFPNEPLKPKHHYLLYYPELISHFVPLIRLLDKISSTSARQLQRDTSSFRHT